MSESLMGDLQDQARSAFLSAETALHRVNVRELHRDPKTVGVFLAFSSSAFIGASFVITRKALQRAAARGGKRAGDGGYAYFSEPLWWVGTLTMVVGEFANFSAYAYAPAILVTPLGAISIIVSSILAHYYLQERLHVCGLLGCFWCVVGSFVLVSFAPEEQIVGSVEEIWEMATQPTFLGYCAMVLLAVVLLITHASPAYGETQVLVHSTPRSATHAHLPPMLICHPRSLPGVAVGGAERLTSCCRRCAPLAPPAASHPMRERSLCQALV